ncbi:MAG: hypothetical protein KGZ57_04430, partial [Dethiobacter sp.]|nr:hypothetical protein [Dethiobacter sp.]
RRNCGDSLWSSGKTSPAGRLGTMNQESCDFSRERFKLAEVYCTLTLRRERTDEASMIRVSERKLSIIIFSLFFSWLIAFLFQGKILHALAGYHRVAIEGYIFRIIAAHFAGLFLCGFFVRTILTAKRLMLFSLVVCLAASAVFFLPPSGLWLAALLVASFLSGASVAAWGFFFKSGTPRGERLKTAASALIYTNILMIVLNMAALLISPFLGLGFAMLMLAAAVPFVLWLPETSAAEDILASEPDGNLAGVARPMAFLGLFIIVVTIASGMMFQAVGPAFAHLEWLTSWYWAVPYIAAIYIVKNCPARQPLLTFSFSLLP